MLLLLFVASDSFAETKDSLNLFTEEFPPYNYQVKNKVVGINHDIVMAMCELANIQCKVTVLPWNRAYRRAQAGENAGIYSTARRIDRESDWQWVGPLLASHVCFYKARNRTDITINSREDLSKYILGVSTSFAYPDKLTELGFIDKINKITFRGLKSKMASVDRKRVDLMLGSVNTMPLQLKLIDRTVEEFVPVWQLELPEATGNYLALNKQVPLAMVNRLKTSYNAMLELGLLQKMKQKYIDTESLSTMSASNNLQRCAEFPSVTL
jgi:polar amino acid transport system substrate-binding protein